MQCCVEEGAIYNPNIEELKFLYILGALKIFFFKFWDGSSNTFNHPWTGPSSSDNSFYCTWQWSPCMNERTITEAKWTKNGQWFQQAYLSCKCHLVLSILGMELCLHDQKGAWLLSSFPTYVFKILMKQTNKKILMKHSGCNSSSHHIQNLDSRKDRRLKRGTCILKTLLDISIWHFCLQSNGYT